MSDEDHRGRALLPDAQQFKLECRSRVCASSEANGSGSMTSTLGSMARARASPRALLHPARQLIWVRLLEALEPHQADQLPDPRLRVTPGYARDGETVSHVP